MWAGFPGSLCLGHQTKSLPTDLIYQKVIAMEKLTHWFDAKLHSPSREGWYDCKECDARHYFKDGFWYRDKKSIRVGSMTIRKLHWRGLRRESLASLLSRFDPNAPRSSEEQAWEAMVPVGMEFGSPDFERLMRKSMKDLKNGKVKPYKFGKNV